MLVETCRDIAGGDAQFTYVDGDYLLEQGVGEWMELPLWLQDPEAAGMHATEVSRAIGAGLVFRPLEDTIRGTLDEAETGRGRNGARAGSGDPRVVEGSVASQEWRDSTSYTMRPSVFGTSTRWVT